MEVSKLRRHVFGVCYGSAHHGYWRKQDLSSIHRGFKGSLLMWIYPQNVQEIRKGNIA